MAGHLPKDEIKGNEPRQSTDHGPAAEALAVAKDGAELEGILFPESTDVVAINS